jgi:hypothetical protein
MQITPIKFQILSNPHFCNHLNDHSIESLNHRGASRILWRVKGARICLRRVNSSAPFTTSDAASGGASIGVYKSRF